MKNGFSAPLFPFIQMEFYANFMTFAKDTPFSSAQILLLYLLSSETANLLQWPTQTLTHTHPFKEHKDLGPLVGQGVCSEGMVFSPKGKELGVVG